MQVLKLGSKGNNVKKWQLFLMGQGFYTGLINGNFDEITRIASQQFQLFHHLEPDGKIGDKSIGAAMMHGFAMLTDNDKGKDSSNWPVKPRFQPLITNAQRSAVFGQFSFRARPVAGNRENIEVTDNWARENIIMAKIPQLVRIKGSDKVSFHKKAKGQLEQLWKDWEDAGMLHLILTWAGSYTPRFIRGSNRILSNHAFGSAFDINVEWNGLGILPPLAGRKGSVRELVELANKNGFYWGGHFTRLDGMHFEVARIL